MKKMRLTNKMKDAVSNWLKLSDGSKKLQCPFSQVFRCSETAREGIQPFCHSWFPRTSTLHRVPCCPCYIYSLKTVKARAREMLEYPWRGK